MGKVFFIHNTIANYRIELFKKISEKTNVEFLITKADISEVIYGDKITKKELSGIKYRNIKNKFNIAYELIKILKNEEFEKVVIPSMDSLGEYIDAIIAFTIGKLKGKEIIYFTEKWQVNKKNSKIKKIKNFIREILTKGVLKNVDCIICSGSKAKEYMIKVIGVKEEKCEIVYDASESSETLSEINLKEKLEIPDESKVILYYGRIVKRKGLDILIQAVNKMKNRERIVLLICGDGEYKDECIRLQESLKLKNVHFLGKIQPKDRMSYFLNSDVFVLPSVNIDGTIEAWGLTVNEAMYAGIPVVASDVVGAAFDMIEDGENGYIFREGDVNQLSDCVTRVINNNEDLSRMKRNAKKTMEESFNYTTMSNGFIEILMR